MRWSEAVVQVRNTPPVMSLRSRGRRRRGIEVMMERSYLQSTEYPVEMWNEITRLMQIKMAGKKWASEWSLPGSDGKYTMREANTPIPRNFEQLEEAEPDTKRPSSEKSESDPDIAESEEEDLGIEDS